jgi:asparagine synthase (glutamine-hydrolysing)
MYLVARPGSVQHRRYWGVPRHAATTASRSKATRELTALVEDSVAGQLVSDVKVGCQLSGGVDSSLVSHWAAKHHGAMFDSVSVIVDDPRYTEERFIDDVTARLTLVSHKTHLDPDTFVRSLAAASWHNDFPLSLPNGIGIFLLAREARRHVTVLLSGEGADEVFGGYHRFYRAAWLRRAARLRWAGSAGLRARTLPFGTLDRTLIGLSAYADRATMSRVHAAFDEQSAFNRRLEIWSSIAERDPVERMLTYEQRTYLVDLLMRQDKLCMAHSIENRVPLLDHRIVEFSKAVPTRFKVNAPLVPRRNRAARHTKRMLKAMAADVFGDRIAYRSKSGFAVPLQRAFAGAPFAAVFEECGEVIRDLGFDTTEVRRLYRQAAALGGGHAETLWIVTALACWASAFLKAPARVADSPVPLQVHQARV